MKILTVNFLTCAVKACKTSPLSFPLHFKDAELEQVEMEYNPIFLRNILPRVDWEAFKTTATELGFQQLPPEKPEISIDITSPTAIDPASSSPPSPSSPSTSTSTSSPPAANTEDISMDNPEAADPLPLSDNEKLYRRLHLILLETQVVQGKMVCGSCGHEYVIKEGIANFLLPNHLV